MKKWKIEINAESQHMAIHMLISLVEQFTKAEMQFKSVGHMLAVGDHGSMSVDCDCAGHIDFTEKMLIDIGSEPDFYRMAQDDTLHCDSVSVYDRVMEHCLKTDIKAYGD